MFFSRNRNKYEFKPGRISERLQKTGNPGRGWYRVYRFILGNEDQEGYCIQMPKEESLCLVEISLENYARHNLPEGGRDEIRTILRYFADNEKDLILRVCYDLEGKAPLKEPPTIEKIYFHMDYCAPVINEFSDRILVFQGIFTGNWGEMHGSRYSGELYIEKLYYYLREILAKDIPIALRRPSFKRLFPEDEKIPLFNDAMFGSKTDLGTYEEGHRKVEMEYQSWAVIDTFNGGEALFGTEGISPKAVIEDMKSMHVSYLNSTYDEKVLNEWKMMPPNMKLAEGEGDSLYDELTMVLGYALMVRQVFFDKKTKHVKIQIRNAGFGTASRGIELSIVAKGKEGAGTKEDYIISPREILPGKEKVYDLDVSDLPKGNYHIMGSMKRRWDGKPVRFSNKGAMSEYEIGRLNIT